MNGQESASGDTIEHNTAPGDPVATPPAPGDPVKQEPAQGDPGQSSDTEPLGDAGARALVAERQARREAERLAKAVADELAQQAKVTQEVEAKAAKAEAELMRYRVSADLGIPVEVLAVLSAKSETELREQAATVQTATVPAPRSPAPDPAQGAKPGSTGPTQLSRADLARMTPQEIEAARQEGRFADLLAGNA